MSYQDRNADFEAAHDPPAPSSAAASPRLSQEQSNRPVLNGQPLRLHAEPDPHIQAGLAYQKYWASRKLD